MDTDNLVFMANRIGEFFQAMPERNEALDGIANHIGKFWAPPMRAAMAAHVAQGGDGLLPLVKEALQGARSATPIAG
jgi:formate dehydrogenase subunit delta